MAITTLDEVLAGARPPVPITKAGITMAAANGARGYTPWYVGGNPGASVATSIGVNGEAVTPALSSVGGMLPRTDPVSGNAYLSRFAASASLRGCIWLIDRLWQNSGLVTTSTTAQAITPATLPSRDGAGGTNGVNVMAAMEWSATGGAGTPTVSLTYTNQAGTTGQTASFTGVTTPPVGTFELFKLAPGDTGIRAPTSLIQSATRTSGSMNLVLFRLIAMLDIGTDNVGNSIDALTSGFPRIYDGSCLQLVLFPNATTATNIIGSYVETQG